ncbi:ATP-binding protein [Halobacteriovorax sp. HFRX-2_2]|uniref:ATP-binding protein n=1 Tax=unclassified Halobacteriovorax TaxID=2639665 RepID=UPI003715A727
MSASAGIGDPYFYEWTVGQRKILDMLNIDNGIESVTLQKHGFTGIDDVVLSMADGSLECIQVKNTRADDTITFSDLVIRPSDEEESLLEQMAKAWLEGKRAYTKISVTINTNRRIGTRTSKRRDSTKIPALDKFWELIKSQLDTISSIDDLEVNDEFRDALNLFIACLSELQGDDKVEFLRGLHLETNMPNLVELEQEISRKIEVVFGVPSEGVYSIFSKLDHALRKWATSNREKEEITSEDVYKAVCAGETRTIGDHNISPPAPFFESRKSFLDNLYKIVSKADKPVTFLTGDPGSGKTSLVSSLANHINPVVHLRFHAFKPIDPSSTMISTDSSIVCTAESLWSDLLSQLREQLRGRLAKFNVPVVNDFLTVDEMRGHVLRLCELYSNEIGSKVVVAIDGIDHAARAGIEGSKFLSSLIPPEHIPESIHILIAGQPPESYEVYPVWLKRSHDLVETLNVPILDLEDVTLLLDSLNVNYEGVETSSLARVVINRTKGNTLPTVFASQEATKVSSLVEFEERLEQLSLSSDLNAYYDNIWSKLVSELGDNKDSKQVYIASSLCLLSQRIQPKHLELAYSNLEIPEAFWKEHLLSLYPLVVSDRDGYHVLHNDVRIFLNSILSSKPQIFKDASSKLLDLLKKQSDMGISRHADLSNLLIASGEQNRVVEFVTNDFVLEAWSLQRRTEETSNYLKQALESSVKMKDWSDIHDITLAMNTFKQILRVTDGTDYSDYSFEHTRDSDISLKVLSTEKYVLSKSQWTLDTIERVISDLEELFCLEEKDRARSLFIRWFSELSIVDLLTVFDKDDIYDFQGRLENEFKDAIASLGYYTSLLDLEVITTEKSEEKLEEESWVVAAFNSGLLKGASRLEAKKWLRQVLNSRSWFSDYLEEAIDYLFSEKKWSHLLLFYNHFPFENLRTRAQIKLMSFVIIAGNECDSSIFDFIKDKTEEMLSDIKGGTDDAVYFLWMSFSKGYIEHTRPVEGISEQVKNIYSSGYRDDRTADAFCRLNYAAVLIGRLFYLKRKSSGVFNHFKNDFFSSFKAIVGIYEIQSSVFLNGLNESVRFVFKGLCYFYKDFGVEIEGFVFEIMKELTAKKPVNGFLEPLWEYWADKNEVGVLEKYYLYYFSTKGEAWKTSINERVGLVQRFKPLALALGLRPVVEETDILLSRRTIGFSEHKDYVFDSLLSWLQDASQSDIALEDDFLLKVLAINRMANELGDNRMSTYVDSEVLKMKFLKSPNHFWSYLNLRSSDSEDKWFNLDAAVLFRSIIEGLEDCSYTNEDLKALWCFTIGALSYSSDDDQATIADLRDGIKFKLGPENSDLLEEMKSLGKAEFSIEGCSYHKESRWFSRKDRKEVKEILSELEGVAEDKINYLLTDLDESNRSDYFRALRKILDDEKKEDRKIDDELVLEIFTKCLENSYGYSWHSEGFDYLVESISWHINSSVVFEKILDQTMSKINTKCKGNLPLWIEAVSNNIDDVCRLRALSIEPDYIKKGLLNWVEVLTTWVNPDESFDLDVPTYSNDTSFEVNSWFDFTTNYFILLLHSRFTEQVYSSLRGLWAVLKVKPDMFKHVESKGEMIRIDVRMRVLSLLERFCIELAGSKSVILKFLEESHQSDLLCESLQAWINLNSLSRVEGGEKVKWTYNRSSKKHEALNVNKAIITKAEKFGSRSLASGYSSVELLLTHLKFLFPNVNVDALASRALSLKGSLKKDYEIPLNFKVSTYNRGMQVSTESDLISLYETLGDDLVDMSLDETMAEYLSLALLKSDDPFLILESPQIIDCDAAEYPPSPDVKDLLGKAECNQALKNELIEALNNGVSDDEIIVAGFISSYTREFDIELYFSWGTKFDIENPQTKRQPSSFNGRSFSRYFEIEQPFGDFSEEWVAWKGGGLSEYSMIRVDLCGWFLKSLELKVSDEDPLRYIDEGGECIVRYERFHGPLKSEVFDPYFRQPLIERWVINKAVFDEFLKENPNFEGKISLQITPYKSPR